MDMGERPRVDVAGVPVSVDHYVAGRRLSSPTTFEDRSPLDWSAVLAEVSAGDASAVDAALSAATEASSRIGLPVAEVTLPASSKTISTSPRYLP